MTDGAIEQLAHDAAELNKTLDRVNRELDRVLKQRDDLLSAAKIGLEEIKRDIKDCGPCEHEINICVCPLINEAEIISKAIEACHD